MKRKGSESRFFYRIEPLIFAVGGFFHIEK